MRTGGILLLVACVAMLACAGSSSPGGPTDGTPAADPGSWEIRSGLSVPRTENSVPELGGFLWVVGGCGATGDPVTAVERYDPAADAWTRWRRSRKG